VSTDLHRLDVGGVSVEVVRKAVKNFHLGVYPPSGRVRVAVPRHMDDDAVRLAVITRLGWIRRRQSQFQGQERQSEREVVTGESHYVKGRRVRLDVVEHDGPPSVRLIGRTRLELLVRTGSDRAKREAVLEAWYRRRVLAAAQDLLEVWEPKIGVEVRDLRVRRMKTRWGSCNAEAGRIWLNTELAKKPPKCLEYVLAHEMVHLLERRHTERFRDLMDGFMPSWRLHRDELNQAPLAHEAWTY
jgi:predicted metal-dependent hydrolase